MKIDTILKSIACGFCFLFLMLSILLFSAYTFEPNIALFVSLFLIAAMFLGILGLAYPVIFKDFIDVYWKEKEEKKLHEETS